MSNSNDIILKKTLTCSRVYTVIDQEVSAPCIICDPATLASVLCDFTTNRLTVTNVALVVAAHEYL